MNKNEVTHTNGAYDVKGIVSKNQIKGIIIKSSYPQVYRIGEKVDFPIYSTINTNKVQFTETLKSLRKRKLEKINLLYK